MSIPIISIRLEGMRHELKIALADHVAKMDADIQAAIDRICTAENIAQIIHDTAEREIKAVIDSEVSSFYRYGAGREAVRKAVSEALNEGHPFHG